MFFFALDLVEEDKQKMRMILSSFILLNDNDAMEGIKDIQIRSRRWIRIFEDTYYNNVDDDDVSIIILTIASQFVSNPQQQFSLPATIPTPTPILIPNPKFTTLWSSSES